MGLAAIINDLHRGRATGAVWSVVIDVSAVLLVLISLTGLVLLYFVHKYRARLGDPVWCRWPASYLVYAIWVP